MRKVTLSSFLLTQLKLKWKDWFCQWHKFMNMKCLIVRILSKKLWKRELLIKRSLGGSKESFCTSGKMPSKSLWDVVKIHGLNLLLAGPSAGPDRQNDVCLYVTMKWNRLWSAVYGDNSLGCKHPGLLVQVYIARRLFSKQPSCFVLSAWKCLHKSSKGFVPIRWQYLVILFHECLDPLSAMDRIWLCFLEGPPSPLPPHLQWIQLF